MGKSCLTAAAGWKNLGFIDFAGSTVVHSVGGWAALAGAIVLGPRIGKYTKDGGIKPILGHNIPLAALGVFILWLGWFGFNPGSTTTADKSIAMIFVNTNLAAAAGCRGHVRLLDEIRKTRSRHEFKRRPWPDWWPLPPDVPMYLPRARLSSVPLPVCWWCSRFCFLIKSRSMIRSAPFQFMVSAAPGGLWRQAFSTWAVRRVHDRRPAPGYRDLLSLDLSDAHLSCLRLWTRPSACG